MSEQPQVNECAAVASALEAYHDGEMGPIESAVVEGHLATCESCRAEMALLGLLAQSLQQVAPPGPSEAMRQRLLGLLAAELAPRRMDILCVERHGQQVTSRDEVRWCPATAARASLVTRRAPALGRMIQQYRQESVCGSGLLCVIGNDFHTP